MEEIIRGKCKLCQIKSNNFDKDGKRDQLKEFLDKPKFLNSEGICIFCENEQNGRLPYGFEIKEQKFKNVHGTEVISKTGTIDDNAYMIF